MNLSQFIDTYRDSITRQIIDHYPPLYRPSADERVLPKLNRRPMAGQENAIRGAALSLQSQPGSVIVGEMGCGKTFIGAAASHMAGFQRVLVLAPPHLTKKWQREIHLTIPNTDAPIINSITDLRRLKTRTADRPLFAIMSRERAKLSYRWKPAVVSRWARHHGRLLRTEIAEEPFRVPAAPNASTRSQTTRAYPSPKKTSPAGNAAAPIATGPSGPPTTRAPSDTRSPTTSKTG